MNTPAPIPPPTEVIQGAPAPIGPPTQTVGGSRFIDLTGRRFGRLTVLARAENNSSRQLRWHTKCDCGQIHLSNGNALRRGTTVSCGCYHREQTSKKALKDITGQRFGRVVVLFRDGKTNDRTAKWQVQCDCGQQFTVEGKALRTGHTKSCGCLSRERASEFHTKNLIGKRFGRLLVVARAASSQTRAALWRAKCDCGAERIIKGNSLRSGATVSCGCFHKETMAARIGKKHQNWKPELTAKDRAHRRLGTPTQKVWMLVSRSARCRDRATCLVCGAHPSTHVHHLEPWANTRNLRYNLDNLVTLCRECHFQFHFLYGNNADLEDFEDYLK